MRRDSPSRQASNLNGIICHAVISCCSRVVCMLLDFSQVQKNLSCYILCRLQDALQMTCLDILVIIQDGPPHTLLSRFGILDRVSAKYRDHAHRNGCTPYSVHKAHSTFVDIHARTGEPTEG